jgi:calcineurin-like phosphoesterase family protein
MKTKLARPGLAQKLAREQTAPGKRSDGVLRLVLISDTHDQRPADVPLGDVLIHAGDFACGDDLHSLRRDIGRLRSLPHRHKILVPGNHDLILTIQPNVRELLGSIHFLSDSLVDIDGVRFYGIGWGSKPIIPAGTDVLISHCPPAGVLDNGMGCPVLRRAVAEARLRVHVFGHIHGCRGHVQLGLTHFYNASLDARQTSQAGVVAASSHTISPPCARPWVHELLRAPTLVQDCSG